MFKKIISAAIIVITAAFALSYAAFADVSSIERAQRTAEEIVNYELKKNGADSIQEWIDGSITENAGKSSEWFVMILSKSGDYDFTEYSASLERYMSETSVTSATTCMKNAMALLSTGRSGKITDQIAESSVGAQGIMSLIYGLHLLNNGCKCTDHTVQSVTEKLLSLQFEDGGWAIMGQNGDIDVTAMTVQALAPQYKTSDNVRRAIDDALLFMSSKQQNDGGYISFGTANPESTSQVLIALSSLGIDVSDPRFIKGDNDLIDGILKYKLPDGSFSHSDGGESNDTATVQAFLALSAYLLSQQKQQRIFDFYIETAPKASAAEAVSSAAEDVPEPMRDNDVSAPPAETSAASSYKPAAYIIIGLSAASVCIILFLLKKRRFSNFVAVIIIASAASAFIFFTNFQSREEYYSNNTEKQNIIGKVTMSIRCDTIVGKSDSVYIPDNGIILDTTEFSVSDGETVYDILTEAARKYGIQLQTNAGYVAGIGYLYEYDFGDLSGWIYHVNGDAPFVMCSDYTLSDGDVIEWLYTCELGNDLTEE